MRFSTGGDPTKSLPLLWRFQEPTNSRKKTGLSVDRIVDTAVEMADAENREAGYKLFRVNDVIPD